MYIEIDKEKLLWALELISRISTKHQTLPVLECVLFEVKKKLTIKGTNLELGMELCLEGNIKEEGILAVPTQPLLQTINLISQKTIELKTEGDVLVVRTKNSHTTIKTSPHSEFPPIPEAKGTGQKINGRLFALGIKTTAFSTSQSSIKPELGSVYVHQKKEHTLTFVATDSFRLVEKKVPQKGVVLDNPILIPNKNAIEISRTCEVVGGDPQMIVSENQLTLKFSNDTYGEVSLTSRLTEGTFPDYQAIIPKEFNTHATLLRADLIHTLKKTNIFTNTFMQVTVSVLPKKNILTLSSDSGNFGKTEENVTASIEGEELTLSFNQRYINEPLQHFGDDSMTLRFAGIGRPMVMEGVSDSSLRYLVMPMNK